MVYGKRPFGGSHQGLSYLARYTHRVAISNHRLVKLEDDRVYFHWRDYRDGGEQKVTHLHGAEFVRRYLLHVLPPGFQRIRYYGLLANRHRAENLERCRVLLGVEDGSKDEETSEEAAEGEESWEDQLLRRTGIDPRRCPVCGEGELLLVVEVVGRPTLRQPPPPQPRAPPEGE